MSFKSFFATLFSGLGVLEDQIKGSRFSQREMNDILANAKKENITFLQELSKINKLSAFEIGYLLSSARLSADKIQTIKKAVEMFNEKEFKAHGQTLSDFIFRVSANLESLNASNLELFKELVQCRNDIYDFSTILKNPARAVKLQKKEPAFAFEKVLL